MRNQFYFFSVQTFNLENEIKQKLEQAGAIVTYYDERPANNNFTKGIIRLKRNLYQNKINSYYKKILTNTKDKKFDYLFVNRGEVVPSFFFRTIFFGSSSMQKNILHLGFIHEIMHILRLSYIFSTNDLLLTLKMPESIILDSGHFFSWINIDQPKKLKQQITLMIFCFWVLHILTGT